MRTMLMSTAIRRSIRGVSGLPFAYWLRPGCHLDCIAILWYLFHFFIPFWGVFTIKGSLFWEWSFKGVTVMGLGVHSTYTCILDNTGGGWQWEGELEHSETTHLGGGP